MRAATLPDTRTQVALIGGSPAMQRMVQQLPRIARAERTTCLYGETGTGKEVVARALHQLSTRASAPFVVVHCGAIPDELFEAEMFGHVRGAFTGATQSRDGLIREAATGTLFLDEINSLSARAQAKLLRYVESGEYRPVGSNTSYRSDAWVIAATNEDLRRSSNAGSFRGDLLYRLEALRIDLPSLRDRATDVLMLAEHFKNEAGGSHLSFSADAARALLQHPWPGNVRELKNRIEAAVILCEGPHVDAAALGLAAGRADAAGRPTVGIEQELWSLVSQGGMTLAEAVEHCEKLLIGAALRAENENRTRAAARLGIHVRTIFKKLSV